MNVTKKQILKYTREIKKLSRLPIRHVGDPILRQKCQEVVLQKIKEKETKRIAKKLIKTIKLYRRITGLGRGLSAPQVGEKKRIIVVWGFEDREPKTLINPKIIKQSKTMAIYPEACVSLPMVIIEVSRPWKIAIEYFDLNGKKHLEKPNPQFSRLLQHEIDHLDGILNIDRGDLKTLKLVFDLETEVKRNTFKLRLKKDN